MGFLRVDDITEFLLSVDRVFLPQESINCCVLRWKCDLYVVNV